MERYSWGGAFLLVFHILGLPGIEKMAVSDDRATEAPGN
jgi:hypothetical protein